MSNEYFTPTQICNAIKAFLDYGEESFNPDKQIGDGVGHGGYFSGNGWAARCLRLHLEQLKNSGWDNGGLV